MNLFVLDNTTATAYRKCPRSGYHRFEEHLTTPLTPAALNFGAAIHKGIEYTLRGFPKDEAIQAALATWRPQEAPREGETEWRNPSNLVNLLDVISGQPPLEVFVAPNGQPVLEVEGLYPLTSKDESPRLYELLYKLGYDDFLYAFIIDAVVQVSGQLYIADHKTTTMVTGARGEPAIISGQYMSSFRPHAQTQGYCWGLSKFLNTPVTNVLINCIGIHKKRIESPNFTAKDYFAFQRFTVNYTPSEIEEWRQSTIQLAEEILLAKLSKFSRMNPDNCWKFNRACPYLPLCQSNPEVRDNLKDRLFVKSEWKPLEVRRNEATTIGGGNAD